VYGNTRERLWGECVAGRINGPPNPRISDALWRYYGAASSNTSLDHKPQARRRFEAGKIEERIPVIGEGLGTYQGVGASVRGNHQTRDQALPRLSARHAGGALAEQLPAPTLALDFPFVADLAVAGFRMPVSTIICGGRDVASGQGAEPGYVLKDYTSGVVAGIRGG